MKRETTDWSALERIEARLRDEKARLARLDAQNNALRVDLERIAREMSSGSRKSPVWVEILGGLITVASIAVIMLGMMLL